MDIGNYMETVDIFIKLSVYLDKINIKVPDHESIRYISAAWAV